MEILAYTHIRWDFNTLYLHYHSGSTDLIPPSNIMSPGNLLEMQIFGPIPDPLSWKLWGGAQQSGFTKALVVPGHSPV